jgi:Zn-dependent metalloprotease
MALSGDQARQYDVPGDVREVWTSSDDGITQTRYQQYVGDAAVYGGQITVLSRDGQRAAVVGNHYSSLSPSNHVKLSKAGAREKVQRVRGNSGKFITTLYINPKNGVRFYEVDSQRADSRKVFHINAQTGDKIRSYDNLQEDSETGTGVKGDTKTLDVTVSGTSHQLVSTDKRQATYDARNTKSLPGTLFVDPNSDGTWNLAGRTSPGQPAGVDAHYYANVTDDFYQTVFSRNSLDNDGIQMVSTAHYGNRYNNAFWNGSQITYGDGDGTTFREFSGGLDVTTHEFTHGVTEFTSDLVYQGESGALNESFSDMMGNSSEFYAAQNGLEDPTKVSPDWQIGEDIYLPKDTVAGFRNMADPAEDGDPDHYSELYTGKQDSGGVHTNSGIPNHAYYLVVNGGYNARDNARKGTADLHPHTGPKVIAIGLPAAEHIFYDGFTSLPSTATMSQARAATVKAATARYGARSPQATSTANAWEAVGVR